MKNKKLKDPRLIESFGLTYAKLFVTLLDQVPIQPKGSSNGNTLEEQRRRFRIADKIEEHSTEEELPELKKEEYLLILEVIEYPGFKFNSRELAFQVVDDIRNALGEALKKEKKNVPK